ncbi:protein of unknown function [Methylocella tundrae]|uniref:Uncharacterized protein n=1 Tax=Methylocella tundrae TaxID=227605 RepID=A0A4U8Z5M0_METTU|nr:protein of unknown function [Methylocella tundrae]
MSGFSSSWGATRHLSVNQRIRTVLMRRWAALDLPLIALAGIGGEKLFEFARSSVERLGVRSLLALHCDVRPGLRHFCVQLNPLFDPLLGIRLDRFGGAFGFADAAVNAFVRMDNEHVFAFIEAVYRTHLHAIHVFALDAILQDDIGHHHAPSRPKPANLRRCNQDSLNAKSRRRRAWREPLIPAKSPQ